MTSTMSAAPLGVKTFLLDTYLEKWAVTEPKLAAQIIENMEDRNYFTVRLGNGLRMVVFRLPGGQWRITIEEVNQ